MTPVDWSDPTWGGRVHVADNGSDVADKHAASEDAAERGRG